METPSPAVTEGQSVSPEVDKVVKVLSRAIVALLNEKQSLATRLVAEALSDLTGGPVTTSRIGSGKRGKTGRGPLIAGERLVEFNRLVAGGQHSIRQLAEQFGVSYQVAYRYATTARKVNEALSQPTQQPATQGNVGGASAAGHGFQGNRWDRPMMVNRHPR